VTTEDVLVVPRSAVMAAPGWHGLLEADPVAFEDLVTRSGRYAPREAMERDPSFKQVIPYLVLRDGLQYYLMRRTRAGGDDRLHDRWSIGVGGHLNPGDGGLEGGLRREWTEELDAAFVPDFRFIGLLNDDTTDVGSVHLGAVYVADATGRPVSIRETDKLTGAFVDRDALVAVIDRMETWSRLVFEHLDAREAGARPR
jgi:predicted NUDIX family phosphoesterase